MYIYIYISIFIDIYIFINRIHGSYNSPFSQYLVSSPDGGDVNLKFLFDETLDVMDSQFFSMALSMISLY